MARKKTGGRKKGTRNRKTHRHIQRLEEGALLGESPLEVMLDNMRHHVGMFRVAEQRFDKLPATDGGDAIALLTEAERYRRLAEECAQHAAPYVHPKLAQIEHGGPGRGAIVQKIEVEYVRATHAKE